jgi:hypothetical protein
MDSFLENAQRIFDVASSGSGHEDFVLLIRPDGGLHFVMEAPFSIEAAAIHAGAATAYRITRSPDGVRVEGRAGARDCVLQQRDARMLLFPDEARYRITSPLLISSTSLS